MANHPYRPSPVKRILPAVMLLLALVLSSCAGPASQPQEGYQRLVILGDPHLPGRDLANKEAVITTITNWPDVAAVIAVGDLAAEFGTDAEYAAARQFFAPLRVPFYPVTGNHDYIYASPPGGKGALTIASLTEQQAKLRLFRDSFRLPHISYSQRIGSYQLIFLSADRSDFLSGLSEGQLDWLRGELAKNRALPTIVVFHGPLTGTLRNYRHWINTPDFVAQPIAAIDSIIRDNPQIFLWLSGHTHTPATEESYASPINLYAGQVTNIHNKDLNRGTIWTNSLFLYPDRVIVRTYNHSEKIWLTDLERVIRPPQLAESTKKVAEPLAKTN